MASINVEANARGYSVTKATFPNPALLILNRYNGQIVSTHATLLEVREALQELPDLSPPKREVQYAGWQTEFPRATVEPGVCQNTADPGCLCKDETFVYFCAYSECHQKAACWGFCPDHYSQGKLLGNLTEAALKHTQAHLERDNYEEYLTRFGNKKVSLKGRDRRPTDGKPSEKLPPLPIGWNVREASGEWTVIDGNGAVLSKGTTALEAASNLYADLEEYETTGE